MPARTDLPEGDTSERPVLARTQLMVAGAAGVAAAVAASVVVGPRFGILVGWDAAALVYVTWVGLRIWRLDAEQTARAAVRADPTRAATDLVLLCAAVVSLVAVGVVIVSAAHAKGAAQDLRVALGLVSVVVSWATVHTVFTLRYAGLYYRGPDGGVNFPGDDRPGYVDFIYLALTIGMTFQVSDTDLESADMRRTALQHALLSYLFGAGILATTVNLVASLSSQ